MAGAHIANVKQWLDQSDIDYFTHFVKAWIPFNAWYRHTYDALEQEREILEAIKNDGNKIRSRFIAKLEGPDPDSEGIRNHIAALHRRLSADPLEDRKKRRVGFENVCIGRNPNAKETFPSYGWTYTVERQKNPQKQIICCVINKSGGVAQSFAQPGEWDLDGFQTNAGYLALGTTDRSRLLTCYRQANPFLFRSLLAEASDKNTLAMDSFKFVNDKTAIFAGVVDVLYAMRNLLFHGELVPDAQTNGTFEPAYHILRFITTSIT